MEPDPLPIADASISGIPPPVHKEEGNIIDNTIPGMGSGSSSGSCIHPGTHQ